MLQQMVMAFSDSQTSITRCIIALPPVWKFRTGVGVISQLLRVSMFAPILEQFGVPSSRYGRSDSLQVVGTPH